MRRHTPSANDAAGKRGSSNLLPPPGTLTLWLLTMITAVIQSRRGWERIVQAIGVMPGPFSSVHSFVSTRDPQLIPTWLTFFTYNFAHTSWGHTIPNIIALWVFGTIAERRLGTWRFVAGYFLAGVIGAVCRETIPPHPLSPGAGASLAISGIVGAYAALYCVRKTHTACGRVLIFIAEFLAIVVTAIWLVFRTVPVTADVTFSLMYHFLPFLAMWLGTHLGYCSWRAMQKDTTATGTDDYSYR